MAKPIRRVKPGVSTAPSAPEPELEDEFQVGRGETSGILVTSIDHGGSTNLIRCLSNDTCCPESLDNIRDTAGDIVCYKPFMDEELKTCFTFLDGGYIGDKPESDIKKALGTLMTINGVLICFKIGRWNKIMADQLNKTVIKLRKIGLKQTCFKFVMTGCELYNEPCLTKMIESLSDITYSDIELLVGGFANLKFLHSGSDSIAMEVYESVNMVLSKCQKMPDINLGLKQERYKKDMKILKRIIASEIQKNELPEDSLFLPPSSFVAEHKDMERRIILVGQTGCGKTAIINMILQKNEEMSVEIQSSLQSAQSVTKKSLKTRPFTLESSNVKEGEAADNYVCQLVDTVGFGDSDHNIEEVKEDLINMLCGYLHSVDVMLFCLKIDGNSPKVISDLSDILEWLIKLWRIKSSNVVFIFTHRDFYSKSFIEKQLRAFSEKPGFKDLMTSENRITTAAPNINELKINYHDYFKVLRQNLSVFLFREITKFRTKLEVDDELDSRYKKLLKQKTEIESDMI